MLVRTLVRTTYSKSILNRASYTHLRFCSNSSKDSSNSTKQSAAAIVPNVRAFYIARRIRLVQMFQKVYGTQRHWLERDSIIIAFPPTQNNQTPDRYAVFFDYGGAVFFNCTPVLQRESIAYAKDFCDGYITQGAGIRADDYSVKVNPELQIWSKFHANMLEVQQLDINNIRVISSVLGQTVALSNFEQMVDSMLKTFEEANARAKPVNSFQLSFGKNRETMIVFELLRESNAVLADVILKLGLLDRTRMRDTAWKYEKYFNIWEGLRDEFELDARWDILNTKTEYLQHNMRFLIEMLNTRKGERLEWMIIILIALELLVSLYSVFQGNIH